MIDTLLERIKERSDFPAMSRTIEIISKQTKSATETSINDLTKTILDDFGLTSKLLKLVNSVAYINYQAGGKIGTVSRAVFIIGYEQVRNAAIMLMLFENLGNRFGAQEFKDTVITAFMTGTIARHMAKKLGVEDTEEAFLCSMFHNLGKLLISYYMPEQNTNIKELMAADEISDHAASKEVLGISYEEIGSVVAQSWNFPENMIKMMRRIPPGPVPAPANEEARLNTLVNFSSELCMKIKEIKKNPQVLRNLIKRYTSFSPFTEKQLSVILDTSMKEIQSFAKLMKVNLKESDFLKKLSNYLVDAQLDDVSEGVTVSPTDEESMELNDTQVLRLMGLHDDKDLSDTADDILTNGIQEVAGALLESTSINDILRSILEIMYRGLKFTTVIICIKNVSTATMEARFGFGVEIEKMTKAFRFDVGSNLTDIFNLAIAKNTDVIINDINDPRFKSRVPEWYRKKIKAETFMIFPLLIGKQPIGLIYADKPMAGDIQIPPHQMTLLRTLRNQAVMAMQKRLS
ncbi:MAG: HDOD domain-containing protein [Nitrospirae bacterium]|nr:HDOD domain-containing protein [Nitrospirota bacterium]